jgi:hypothetical protein
MKLMTLFVAMLCFGTGLQAAGSGAGPLVVKGGLYHRDGSAAAGVRLYAFAYKDQKAQWSGLRFLEDNTAAPGPDTPVATTDKEGRFRLEIPRSYLADRGTEEFVLGLFTATKGGPRPLSEEGTGATLVLGVPAFEKRATIDLAESVGRILVD